MTKKGNDSKKIAWLFSRYIAILLLGLGNLYLFYKVLTPITVNVLAFLLSLFTDVVVEGTFIGMNHYTLAIVPACVAGSAFYLLFILIFSTPSISPKKRSLILVGSFISLFVLNILRILFLILIINQSFFGTVHWIFWNLVSTLFVVGVWFVIIYLYDVKFIPIYSDLKYVWGLVKNSK